MRHLLLAILFLAPTVLSATTLDLDTVLVSQPAQTVATIITSANSQVKVCDKSQPTQCQFVGPPVASTHKLVMWFSLAPLVTSSLRATPTTCSAPCELDMRRIYGVQYYSWEEVTGGGSSLSPKVIGPFATLPLVEPPQLAAGAWTLPVEVVCQDDCIGPGHLQFAAPTGSATMGLALYMRVNNPSYEGYGSPSTSGGLNAPWDSKMSYQICQGTTTATCTPWESINNSTMTCIDQNCYFGQDGSHTIGAAAAPTIELTVPVPDHAIVANSTNNIAFRFNRTEGVTSGFRVLDWAIIQTSTATDLSQCVITSNVSVCTALSGTQPFSTGNDVLAYRLRGIHGRLNGRRNLTATSSSTFTFAACGSGLGFYTPYCTSPNGTYTPVQNYSASGYIGVAPQVTTPTMDAVLIVAPSTASLVWDDPSTWTAPGGGNATNGQTAFQARNTLLNANAPYVGYTLKVACSDCHASDGRDLKYFNYSNTSIEQRTLFHGLSWQTALDIAAFIRGNAITVPASARPWNPVQQPIPGLTAGALTAWDAGGGIDAIPEYEEDIAEYMPISGWGINGTIDFHEVPLPWSLMDWNHMLPMIHPQDGFPNAATPFFSSDVYSAYTTAVSDFAPQTSAAYTAHYADVQTMFSNMSSTGSEWVTTNAGAGIDNSAGRNGSSFANLALYSTYQWGIVKLWELMHDTGLFEGDCSQLYTAIYGARGSGNYYARCWVPGRLIFNFGPHIFLKNNASVGLTHTMYIDGNAFSPSTGPYLSGNTPNWETLTNQQYAWSAVNDCGNYHLVLGSILDEGYYPGFFDTMTGMRPGAWYSMMVPPLLFAQCSQDVVPYYDNSMSSISGDRYVAFRAGNLLAVDQTTSWAWTDPTSMTNMLTKYVTNLTDLINAYTVGQWNTVLTQTGNTCGNPGDPWAGGQNILCDNMAMMLPMARFFGVSTTTLNTLAAALDTLSYSVPHTFETDVDALCFEGAGRKNAYWPACQNFQNGGYFWKSLTTLGATVTATSGVGITFSDCTNIPNPSAVQIETEVIIVTAGAGTAGMCTVPSGDLIRGAYGTAATTHTNGLVVNN